MVGVANPGSLESWNRIGSWASDREIPDSMITWEVSERCQTRER
jgi:hypothetical protein